MSIHPPTFAALGAICMLIVGPAIWALMRGEKAGRQLMRPSS